MKYKIFDKMNEGSTRNRIIELLYKEALTTSNIANKLNLDRTSIHYHLDILLKENKVSKVKVKRFYYYGLTKEVRV